jgi:ribonuclease HI
MKKKITPEVEIFTDGACSGNPGPGGWGAIIRFGKKEVMISGFMPNTTNNRMELLAAISALEEIATPSLIELTSDSKYLLDGIEKWIKTWKLKGWKTSSRKDVKNVDLWKRLDELNQKHQIIWKHIPGHKGHRENELCDELARNEIIKNRF